MKIKLYNIDAGEKCISEYPIGLGYLKTNCHGADIEIVNSRAELTDCDLIGLSATAYGLKEAVDIMESSDIPVVVGGYGTLWDGLKDYGFKHIVIGEGEVAFQRIIDGDSKKVIREELIEDMDTLRYPDRGECGNTVPIFPSRGCPFNCRYCCSKAMWKRARFHSADYFMSEVDYISERYPKALGIYLVDDLFIANKTRFNEIYEKWMSKGLNKRFRLTGYVRANIFTEQIGIKMKAMGFGSIRFGAESGSDRILKLLNKQATVADNQRTIDIANKIGLPITAAFIYGLPTETPEEKQMTIDFVKKNYGRIGRGGWYKFVPFPGTDFYNGENPLISNMNFRGNIAEHGLCGW
jgi:radical SAM superfamily enzyme YgiQ (UPF0313 family)